ncbi:GntR family transcriptional regulator [Aureimonas sp. SA4125]|uniref:GntR family transcriptional regulator n=1 Tax=Aureimonas sp. SA4125 TaxID=2826993 RepID=UPI001CC4CD5A|nr:GntR family transcriptional regulator [Aureimonas sp. SA4125]BDA86478.1 GntR family transcriptional regulator [Aureimonas sp. SA4125]
MISLAPEPPLQKPSDKTTSATLVYHKLRRDILNGTMKPGQKLQIDQVAQRYDSGINPVREALNRLSAERLVDRRDQRGFFVPPLTLRAFRELVQSRCWIEALALEQSILNRTQAWEDELITTHYRLDREPVRLAGEEGDNSAWEERHRAFHNALIGNSGSSWITGFCHDMMDHAERYRFASMSGSYPRRDSREEHRAIMEATIDGDIARATERLTAHYRLTLRQLEEQTSAPVPGEAEAAATD